MVEKLLLLEKRDFHKKKKKTSQYKIFITKNEKFLNFLTTTYLIF